MHSPPVQPICSSRSGTGSVITMCEEVTGEARREPVDGARARAHAEHRGARPHRAAGRVGDHPAAVAAQLRYPRALEDPHAALEQLRAQPEREPRRLHGRKVRHEDAAPEDGRVAARADLLRAELLDRLGRPSSAAARMEARPTSSYAGAVETQT